MIEVGMATAADLERFYGAIPGPTVRAVVVRRNGEPIGIAGLAQYGFALMAFTEMRDAAAAEDARAAVTAGLLQLKRWIRNAPGRVLATADPDQPGTAERLARFGFEEIGETEAGRLFQWPH